MHMTAIYHAVALFLMLNLVGGLLRILRGPSAADRMIAAQLFGTTGVAVLVVLAAASGSSALRDTALVFALLAVVNTAVFVGHEVGARRTAPSPDREPEAGP
jgi:multicomponent Na+:H+ antiporter subunit F